MLVETFGGIRPEALELLLSLRAGNSRAWYQAHRTEYADLVIRPLRGLVHELSEDMLAIDPGFEVAPSVGKTISRIHRDVRFSRDKRPLRDNAWVVFQNHALPPLGRPAFFFEFGPHLCRYGMGFYDAAPARMADLRRRIDAAPGRLAGLLDALGRDGRFRLISEPYARLQADHLPAAIRPWYVARRLHLECPVPPARLADADLADAIRCGFCLLGPVYRFIAAPG